MRWVFKNRGRDRCTHELFSPQACEVLSLHYRISPDSLFALCSCSLLCLHSPCLIPELGGPWSHCVHLTQVSLCRPREFSWLIWSVNESLRWFILLRLLCFSAMWSARYRKSSCTQVDLTLLHLSKALSSLTPLACASGVPESLWTITISSLLEAFISQVAAFTSGELSFLGSSVNLARRQGPLSPTPNAKISVIGDS